MNRLFIIGNLTRDPESRTTQSGKQVCSFTVAVNRRQSANAGQPEADYFRVSAWNELGQNCARYLAKGRKVAVLGSVSVSTYQGNDGQTRANMDVLAQEVEFLTPRENTSSGAGASPVKAAQQAAPAGYVQVEDEDLPF